jgi:hypothetical protein
MSYRSSLSWIIPTKIRRGVLDAYERIVAKYLLRSRFFRDLFIRKEIEHFIPNQNWANWANNHSLRIAAYWDNDGRFRWLKDPAASRNIGLLHIPRSIYRPIFSHLLQKNGYKPDERKGEISLNVFYEERFKKYRKTYLQYCSDVAESIARQFSIDIFLLFKLNDDWIIDVIKGIRMNEFAVVVHDRESGITKKRLEVYPQHLRYVLNDLTVDKLCVSNTVHQEFFERCGFPREKIILTGKPDADYWSHLGRPLQRQEIDQRLRDDCKLIVFFAFGRLNYLNFFYKGEKRDWAPLCADHHRVLIDILRTHKGNVQIAYKIGGKPARDNYPGFDLFVKEASQIGGPNSVVVLDGNNPTLDLLRVSDIVVGFHTMGLVEATFTHQPVLYGAWGGLFEDIKDTLMPLHLTDSLIFCNSKESLLLRCNEYLSNENQWHLTQSCQEARKKLQNDFFFNPDGHSSDRLLDAIVAVAQERGLIDKLYDLHGS